MANEEHMQRVEAHYRALGMENPHASHFASMRGRSGGGSRTGGPLGSGATARSGGLGSGKGAARYERTSAEDRRKANNDGKFGYFDEANKRYVPALFDAIDGGGRDTRGDEFSGGPLSGILNDLGVDPYGSQRERMFVSPNTSPIVQAVARPRARPFDAAMANQEMSFTQPNTTPMNAQEMSFRQPISNPFMGPTYDMPVDPRAQFNSLTGGPLGSGGNVSGAGSGNLSQLRSESVTGGAPEGFSRFLEMAKNDPTMSFLVNNPEMAKSVYDKLVASGTPF